MCELLFLYNVFQHLADGRIRNGKYWNFINQQIQQISATLHILHTVPAFNILTMIGRSYIRVTVQNKKLDNIWIATNMVEIIHSLFVALLDIPFIQLSCYCLFVCFCFDCQILTCFRSIGYVDHNTSLQWKCGPFEEHQWNFTCTCVFLLSLNSKAERQKMFLSCIHVHVHVMKQSKTLKIRYLCIVDPF